MPMAFPRSPMLNTEVIIAMLVPKIMAPEMPWLILIMIRYVRLGEKIIKKVEIVNRIIPAEKIFFLPVISASLPKGRRKTDEDSMKLLITHPSPMALAPRSSPIAGRARLTAEPRKGVRKAAKVDTSRTDPLNDLSSELVFLLNDFSIELNIRPLLLFTGVNNYCYRSVVDQLNLHHCPEFACGSFISR